MAEKLRCELCGQAKPWYALARIGNPDGGTRLVCREAAFYVPVPEKCPTEKKKGR